jgi:hypothetical protein
MCARCTFPRMHLAEFMTAHNLSDDDVAAGIGRNRVSVSRYRRRLVRPDWEAIDNIKAYTKGAVAADDWLEPLKADKAEQPQAAQ